MSNPHDNDDDYVSATLGVGSAETTRTINVVAESAKIDRELATSTAPVLIVIRGIPQGRRYLLEGRTTFVLGRGQTADIQIDDANVSRNHAQISIEREQISITDQGSRNGTFLNDEPLGRATVELAREDMIKVGNTILKYLPAGQFETLYHINIANAAHRDPLTDLFNRQYISDVLEVEFKRAKALHTAMSVVFFDIDDFKLINDAHGHEGGDHVLISLGACMREVGLGDHDLAGRYGGEEFIVVLSNSTVEEAAAVAEKIRRHIKDHAFMYAGQRIPVTVSLGVAAVTAESRRGADILRLADTAMYESKRTGKNRVTVAASVS
jgi:two-component system cell cycle response regulator